MIFRRSIFVFTYMLIYIGSYALVVIISWMATPHNFRGGGGSGCDSYHQGNAFLFIHSALRRTRFRALVPIVVLLVPVFFGSLAVDSFRTLAYGRERESVTAAVNTLSVGESVSWSSPSRWPFAREHSGTVAVLQTFERDQLRCREFVFTNAQEKKAFFKGTVCEDSAHKAWSDATDVSSRWGS